MAKVIKPTILSVYDDVGNKVPIPAIKGESAYASAVKGGYTGTIEEFYAELAEVSDKANVSDIPDISGLATKEELNTGLSEKQDKGNYALKSDLPTRTSDLNNDSDFTTNLLLNAGLKTKADTTYVDEQLSLKANKDYVDTELNKKATKDDLALKEDTVSVDEKLKLKADKTEIPTDNKQLKNGAEYITKVVSDLVNYYTKSETYTQQEINDKISAIPKFSIKAVDKLPEANISDTAVYLLKEPDASSPNMYTEYIHIDDKWEILGSQQVNLEGYLKDTDIADWAKEPNKPTYTAKEVGAIPEGTFIPMEEAFNAKAEKTYVDAQLKTKADTSDIPTVLPNPKAVTFKKRSFNEIGEATEEIIDAYDGSSAKNIEIPSDFIVNIRVNPNGFIIIGKPDKDFVAINNAYKAHKNIFVKANVENLAEVIMTLNMPFVDSSYSFSGVYEYVGDFIIYAKFNINSSNNAGFEAYTIPNPDTKTGEMTEPVGMDAQGKLFSKPQNLSAYATTAQLTQGLAGKANTGDIPDISGLATKTELTQGLAGKQNSGDYATTAQLAGKTNGVFTIKTSSSVPTADDKSVITFVV